MLKKVCSGQAQRQERYRQMAALAVEQEKEGHWCEAAALWESSAEIARLPQNLGWARCRADFCRKKYDRLNNRLPYAMGGHP